MGAGQLWKINQRKLALKLIYATKLTQLEKEEILIVTILSLIHKNYKIDDIPKYLLESKKKVTEIIKKCKKYGLIENSTLTDFGKDLITRAKLISKVKDKTIYFNKDLIGDYYPNSINGFQRKSSN